MAATGGASKELRGRRKADYTVISQDRGDPKTEIDKVELWKRRIKRGMSAAQFGKRRDAAAIGLNHLGSQTKEKAKRVYMPYLRPMLEDSHRNTYPGVPTPRIEESNELVKGFSNRATELINVSFRATQTGLDDAIGAAQWDDALTGLGILKTRWVIKYDQSEPAMVTDPLQIELEVQHAMDENAEPIAARISDSDNHFVHTEVHNDALAEMPPGDPAFDTLGAHVQLHAAELVSIRREFPRVERVSPFNYVYDPDVPWINRAWEAELRSVRIKDLLEMGYKNVNPTNLPVEKKPGEELFDWEDMTAQVWDIHDRRSGEYFVMPQNKNAHGLFLFEGEWPYGNIDIYIPLVFHPLVYDELSEDDSSQSRLQGDSIVTMALPLVEELAFINYWSRIHIQNHAAKKDLIPRGRLSDLEKSQINDPNKRTVEVDPSIIMGTKSIETPPLPPALQQRFVAVMSDLRRLVGSDAQDTGGDHPHEISATESSRRAQTSDTRLEERRRRLSMVVAQIAKNFLTLYKRFATKDLMVRTIGPEGPVYLQVDPSDIPDDIDLFVDLRAETDEVRADMFSAMKVWLDTALVLQYPINTITIVEYMARLAGIQRPDQFRADLGEEAVLPLGEGTAGAPGIPNQTGASPGTQNIPFVNGPAATPAGTIQGGA